MSSKFPGEKKDQAAGARGHGVDVDLLELENYIHDIWKFLPVPICQISPRGVILDTDKAFEELLKYPKNELVGTLLSSYFVHKAEFEHIQEATLTEGSVKDYRLTLKSKEKDNILVNVSTLVRKDDADQRIGYFVSFIDVTEREKAGKTLRESEEKYRDVVEHSLQGIIIVQGDPVRIRFTNKALAGIFGYLIEELLALTPKDIGALIHPNDREETLKRLQGVLAGNPTSPRYQLRIRKKDGTFSWVEISGALIRYEAKPAVQVSVLDITDRKRIEEELKESEQKFRTLAEQSPNMIFISCKNRVVYANKRCEELMGYTRDEFLSPGFDFLTLIAPESVDLVESAFAEHMKGNEVAPFEYSLITKDGSRIDAILAPKLIEFEGEKAILGVITDITEYKRTLQALSESESRYKILVETSPEAITVTDLEGYITDVSKRAIELCGAKSAGGIIGKKSLELIVPEDRERAVRNMEKTLKDGFLRNAEYAFFRMDGSRYIGELNAAVIKDVHGKPKAFIATIRDITQRKWSEDALRESEEKYRLLLEQSGDIITYFNEEGKLLAMNRNAAEGLKGSPEGFVEKHLSDMFDEDISKVAQERISRVVKSGESEEHEDFVQLPTGKGWFRSSYNLVRGAKGDVVGVQIISRDITERKKMEEELQRSERMKLLAQLAIGVSHEVRNPLGAILASTEALYHDLEEHAEYSEYLSHIRIQVNRLSVLMKDLLELGKPIGESTFENESLQMVCSSGVELWKQSTIFKHHTMKFVKPAGFENIIVRADGARLQQVCINLLENAAQNSPEGSEIILKIFEPEAGSVRIQVIDEGSGIKTEDLDRVFEPFFSTRRQGSGLGLSIVKQIVETHGGAVEIRNNEGGSGCTAEIYLPVIS